MPENLANALEYYDKTKITNVWEARYLMMNEAYMQQTSNLITCYIKVEKIGEWDLQQQGIFNESRKTAN